MLTCLQVILWQRNEDRFYDAREQSQEIFATKRLEMRHILIFLVVEAFIITSFQIAREDRYSGNMSFLDLANGIVHEKFWYAITKCFTKNSTRTQYVAIAWKFPTFFKKATTFQIDNLLWHKNIKSIIRTVVITTVELKVLVFLLYPVGYFWNVFIVGFVA